MRRVDQAYVIATKTQVSLENVKLPDRLTDETFKRQKKKKHRREEDMFESTGDEVSLINQHSSTTAWQVVPIPFTVISDQRAPLAIIEVVKVYPFIPLVYM